SSLTSEGAQTTLRALSAGAVDFVAKPSGYISIDLDALGRELAEKVVAASMARVFRREKEEKPPEALKKGRTSPLPPPPARRPSRPEIIAMAASTGGPRALQSVLSEIPGNFPLPIVIVQHMPADFTLSFARRLDSLCALDVEEGTEGMVLRPGLAVVAPGGYHMIVQRKTSSIFSCSLSDAPPVLSVKPSANVLFRSVAEVTDGKAVGIILTGMGRDGAEGAAAMRAKGSHIIAESQETCVVYGMPKAAVELGVVDELLPLDSIPEAVLRSVR
ncbi:MAG: chemotaxis-specific protein-glutamate methyltransferase CheB, partial [Synergistaceae bacterium]|nr:chemotaxis-specific protein-glutamate methyltransferase CheB [Synergistaceae bacterium]